MMGNPYQKVITHFPSQALTETVIAVEIQELMVGIVDGMSYETGVPTPSINDVFWIWVNSTR